MSKLTTKGNRRIAAKIDVMTANKRTIGATNYSPTAVDLKGRPKVDKSKPVPGRNIGKKGATKSKGSKVIPAGPAPVGKVKAKKKRKAKK